MNGDCSPATNKKFVTSAVENLFSSLTISSDENLQKKLNLPELMINFQKFIFTIENQEETIVCDFSTFDTGDTEGNALTIYHPKLQQMSLFFIYLNN